MKKLFYFIALFISINTMQVFAQDGALPSTSTEIYELDKLGDHFKLLDIFKEALENGRKYPTKEELNDLGIDLEFLRSHVRPADIIVDKASQLNPNIEPSRRLWLNVPTGNGKDNGGFPSASWNDETFTMWPYTSLHGAWNHGWFKNSGAYASAAHKHGTDMLSGLMFFDTGVGSTTVFNKLTQKKGGEYVYAEPLINLLMFLGQDGINYNVEGNNQVSPTLQDFHIKLYELAKEKGFNNFHVGYYNNHSSLGTQPGNLWKNGKRVSDALMLNYWGGDFTGALSESVSVAESLDPKAVEGLFAGAWIVTLNRAWNQMYNSPKMNMCLWGEHDHFRIYSYGKGANAVAFQENYQERLERFISGGNRNPANAPQVISTGIRIEDEVDENGNIAVNAMTNFHGLATYFAERSTLKGNLPFRTYFNTGNGKFWNYKGKKSFDEWYNLGAQDIQPTYRWLVYNAGTKDVSTAIQPRYSYEDSYIGGSCLELSGKKAGENTDIILYRSLLNVEDAITAEIAFKMVDKENVSIKPEGTATNLYLILNVDGTWKEYAVGNTTEKAWNVKSIPLTDIPVGSVIKNIGLRVKGQADNYQIFVGEIELKGSKKLKVPTPENIKIEVKEETTAKLSVKIQWEVPALTSKTPERQDYGMIFNDEVNVDHFEIFYKNGEKGTLKEIGRTNTWTYFAGKIYFENNEAVNGDDDFEEPYVGVRSASVDLSTVSPIVWTKVERQDYYDVPEEEKVKYCKTELDPNKTGADVARAIRYLEYVTTTGADEELNYVATGPDTDGDNYVDYSKTPFKVTAGKTFKFKFKAFGDNVAPGSPTRDGLQWCFANAYADWNADGIFDTNTETIFSLGTIRKATPEFQTTGVEKDFNVPADACPGKVRLRVVFTDAWPPPSPAPCGKTNKGFSIDFGMIISNANPSEDCGKVITFTDQGTPELPEKWDITANDLLDHDAKLTAMAVSEGVLVPEFSGEITDYTVNLPYGSTLVPDVTVTAANTATVKKTDATALTTPNNVSIIDVTAEDNTSTMQYKITFNILPPPEQPATPICKIQKTESEDGVSPLNGDNVKTSGVVTATAADGYYIQDGKGEWKGIWISDRTNKPKVGNSLLITGLVSENEKNTEIKAVSAFKVIAEGQTLPEPVLLSNTSSANDEKYEGVLVKIENALCTNGTNADGEWILNDGSGDISIDDNLYKQVALKGGKYTVTGVVLHSAKYKILPRNANDISEKDMTIEAKIADIQKTLSESGDSDYKGKKIKTSGVVTATTAEGYYIQDGKGEWTGVWVSDGTNKPKSGNSLLIVGVVNENNKNTEINTVSSYTVVEAEKSLPEAIDVSTKDANDEKYEGVIVKVENAVCKTEADENKEWNADDESGVVVIGKKIYEYTPEVDKKYIITGIIEYAADKYKLNLLGENYISIVTSIYEATKSDLKIYPNPTNGIFFIKADKNINRIEVLNVSGAKLIDKTPNNKEFSVDITNYPAGFYLIKVTSEGETQIHEVIKK